MTTTNPAESTKLEPQPAAGPRICATCGRVLKRGHRGPCSGRPRRGRTRPLWYFDRGE